MPGDLLIESKTLTLRRCLYVTNSKMGKNQKSFAQRIWSLTVYVSEILNGKAITHL